MLIYIVNDLKATICIFNGMNSFQTFSVLKNSHKQEAKDNALRMAASGGSLKTLDYLLNPKYIGIPADIYAQDCAAFKIACYMGKMEVIEYMVINCQMQLNENLNDFLNEPAHYQYKNVFVLRDLKGKLQEELKENKVSNIKNKI